MAYIPPHKRHSEEANPTLTPAPPPSFQSPRKVNSKQKPTHGEGVTIPFKWIWFVIPSSDPDGGDGQSELSGSIRMKEFVVDSTELKDWKKYMIVDRVGGGRGEVSEAANRIVKSPWVSIIEKIQQDLLTSFQTARDQMGKEVRVLYVPRFVIRFGKFLFYGSAFDFLDNYNKSSAVENLLRPLGKRLYTCVPDSFREAVLGQIIPKVGLDFVEEKEHYIVKVFDKIRGDVTISCKCSVNEATGKLNLDRIELKEIRQMVVDISCLENSLDLRLSLSSKRILTSPTDDEKDALNCLVNSAVKDSEVKGGLRWPLGKESVGDRYVVVGVGHTISKLYNNPFMTLKIRNADRFDFRASTGDIAHEVSLLIPEITSQLLDATTELNPLLDTVRDSLKLVWENFVSWEGSLT